MLLTFLLFAAAVLALLILRTAPNAKLGIKCVAYLNTGSFGTPTWTAITCISDWKWSPKWKEGEASTRASLLELVMKTMLGLEITGKLRASDANDTTYPTISAALLTSSVLDVLVLNGTQSENGAWGFRCDFQLFDASEDQGLNVVVFDEVLLKPSVSTNSNYSTALVTAGAPVFTAI